MSFLDSLGSFLPTWFVSDPVEKQRRQIAEEERIRKALISEWNEHLSNFALNSKTLKLINSGIPASLRTRAWPILIGNRLNITPQLVHLLKERALVRRQHFEAEQKAENDHSMSDRRSSESDSVESTVTTSSSAFLVDQYQIDSRESTLTLIARDVSRTLPTLAFFAEGQPMNESCRQLLEMWCTWRIDSGYTQGMSYPAALLLLYLELDGAFICYANLVSQPMFLEMYSMQDQHMSKVEAAFVAIGNRHLRKLFQHFESLDISPRMYIWSQWLPLFTRSA